MKLKVFFSPFSLLTLEAHLLIIAKEISVSFLLLVFGCDKTFAEGKSQVHETKDFSTRCFISVPGITVESLNFTQQWAFNSI